MYWGHNNEWRFYLSCHQNQNFCFEGMNKEQIFTSLKKKTNRDGGKMLGFSFIIYIKIKIAVILNFTYQVYYFPKAALPKCHKLDDLKQQKFYSVLVWSLEVWNQRVSRAMRLLTSLLYHCPSFCWLLTILGISSYITFISASEVTWCICLCLHLYRYVQIPLFIYRHRPLNSGPV